MSDLNALDKMVELKSLVINPELIAIIGIEAAHVPEAMKGALDAESDADFFGPFAFDRLIERFPFLDASAGKFRHVRCAEFRRQHDRIVIDGDRQRKNAATRLDDGVSAGRHGVAASIVEND